MASRRIDVVVALLALLMATGLELALARAAGPPRGAVILGLLGFAAGKATVIALVFMGLARERSALRLTVFLPMLAPAAYAVVLMADAAWRHAL